MSTQLRITADEVKRRMSAGEQFTIVDARNPQAWADAVDKAQGAIRVDAHAESLPTLPKDKPVVVYCT
jgi:rhodanese-related sulfurtransferase